MTDLDFLLRLLVSLAIGGLIGLEREQHREHELVIAGVRTYPLIAVSGMLLAWLAQIIELPSAVPIGIGLFGALAIAYAFIRHLLKLTGLTSPVAIIVTYLIGVLVGYGRFVEGVAVGVAVTFLLLSKGPLHSFAQAVSQSEMMGALQFILVAFILYPVALSAGPLIIGSLNVSEILNLSSVLLTVILVSVISFVSFLAIKYFGSTKGLAFSGVLGGLVNSEAATASLTSYVPKSPRLTRYALSGILLANTGMLIRNLVISALADGTLRVAGVLFIPAAVMAELSVFYFIWYGRNGQKLEKDPQLQIESPFGMKPAITLGLLIAFTSVIIYILAKSTVAGTGYGIYLTSLIGFFSSAAVAFSVSALAFTGQVSPLVAGEVATLACLFSTMNKLIIIRSGSKELAGTSWKLILSVFIAGLVTFVAVDIYLRTVLGWGP